MIIERISMIVGRIVLGIFFGSMGAYITMILLDQVMKVRTRAVLFVALLSLALETMSGVYLIIMNILAI